MRIRTVGTLLYWCEGSKRERDRRVEFVNSDPMMVAIFMKYLRTLAIDENRIKARLMLHLEDSETECINYWKSITNLRNSNFISSVVFNGGTGKAKRRLPFGTITIRYNSLALLRKVNDDIRRLAMELA